MKEKPKTGKWIVLLGVILFLLLIGFILSAIVSIFFGFDSGIVDGNVAVIPIKGVIMADKTRGFFSETASSSDIVELIKKADENPEIKAIIFDINSPGGSAVASDEIAGAIKKANKTTVSVIREVGASGAYWVASSCDYVIANRMSITGSIGVIASYLQFSGLLNDYNVTYERVVAGKYKDMGSPFKELTPAEKTMFDKKLGILHNYFIEEVAKNRKLSKDEVAKLADGQFFIGSEAKDVGLVDMLGNMDDAAGYIERKLNITAEITEYKKPATLIDILSEAMSENSFFVGKGIGYAMFENKDNGISIRT